MRLSFETKIDLFCSDGHLANGHLPIRRHDATKRGQHEQPQSGNDASAAESKTLDALATSFFLRLLPDALFAFMTSDVAFLRSDSGTTTLIPRR